MKILKFKELKEKKKEDKLDKIFKKHGHNPKKMTSLGTRPNDDPTKKKPNLGYIGIVGQSLKNLEGGLKKKNMKESKVLKFDELVKKNKTDETIYDFVIRSPKGSKKIKHTGTHNSLLKPKWDGYHIISMTKSVKKDEKDKKNQK